jgi:hypothetical protein
VKPRGSTLRRMNAALNALAHSSPITRPPALIAAFVRSAELVIANEIGNDRKLIAACAFARQRKRGRKPKSVEPERIKRLAIYLTAVELQVENAELARAIGCSRQNVKQARDDIEELRDDGRIDALLDRCAALVTGK